MQEKLYTADIYLRLSKDDGDKEESDSITNQRALIMEYLKDMPDIRVNKVRIDDGYSGVDFRRPAFSEMLEDIKAELVNCVVVKDFSRFARNYIEAGKYIQVLFPHMGVRFIAVNDRYDSLSLSNGERLVSALKNLINDMYAKDISRKVCAAIHTKQKNGAFIGATAAYGYLKDSQDKISL